MRGLIRLSVLVLIPALLLGALLSCGVRKEGEARTGERAADQPARQLKAGFIYVGPVGDYGWSHSHDQGRKYAESKLPWLETVVVESVAEGDVMRIIDRLVNEEKVDVIFTTSYGYMDDTVRAAEKYRDVFFFHCSGFKRAPNLGTYFAELYQIYYLNGLIAGALTQSNQLGYVAAFPISEVLRHINAFALGAQEANPRARVDVRWIFSWYDPVKAREAAQSFVAAGADVLAFTEDSPAVIEVGQEHTEKGRQVYTFGHYSPMQKFGEDSAVSGQLVVWGPMYVQILTDVYNGKTDFSNYDIWWRAAENAAMLGAEVGQPINPRMIDRLRSVTIKSADLGEMNAYDYVLKRYEQIKANQFEPFTGPVKDQRGVIRIPAGEKADTAHLLSIDYFVSNVVGEIPKR